MDGARVFVGAIESEFRRWFDLNKARFRGRSLFVGCSGNFTIEQLLGDVAGAMHSNDVSIYSHFLGHHLAGQPFGCKIKTPEWEWLTPFLEENAGACMVLLFELLKWDATKNLYQKRIHDHILGLWEWHFEKTAERVQKAKDVCRITSYRSSDIWDFADAALDIDPEGIFLAFLPFYKGGYEKLYKKLDDIFVWEVPKYEIIDADRKAQLIAKIKRFDHVFIDDVFYENEPAVMLKRKTATKRMWLYSNLDLRRVLVQAHPREKPTFYTLLTDEDLNSIQPDSTITIKRVKAAEMNYYRNRYLAKGIEFVDGMWNFFLFVDGKLFGFAILTHQKYGEEGLYLLSDFAVPLGAKSRISKLVLWILQSTHFREICEELTLARCPKLTTTAFTEKAVSMKYRGAFELKKRGDQNGKKFINYETATGLHDDRAAICKWKTSRKSLKN